jgi:hypothetical protein
MVTLVRPVQLAKVQLSMLVTLPGMVTLVSLVQREKAESLMLVTLEGMEYAPFLPLGQTRRT